MPGWAIGFVTRVEAVNYRLGRMTMYLLFVMMGILLWSSVSKTFFLPSLWTLETAQFSLVAYYMFGGPYSLQRGAHVRMDLLYSTWNERQKAWVDAFTVIALVTYLGLFLYGGYSSTSYSVQYNERSPTAWRPYLWPIKLAMCTAAFLMLLQAICCLIRDIAVIRGAPLPPSPAMARDAASRTTGGAA
ncbi:MAG: TRAP transporter small permease subunit [Pseudomonadota bacterium]